MFVEHAEVSSFLSTWKYKKTEQAVEELASYSLETKRIPDPYSFLVDNEGDLFSPSAGCKVKNIIRTDNPVGIQELRAFEVISEWAKSETFGAIAWISPPYPGIYPASKIIVSELEEVDGAKRLFNRAIVLDMDGNECLRFAHAIAEYSLNRPFLTHLDELRAVPIILDTKDKPWIDIFENLIGNNVSEIIKTGQDKESKREALIQAHRIFSTPLSSPIIDIKTGHNTVEKMVAGMLGSKSGSCPVVLSGNSSRSLLVGTSFEIFSQHSLTVEADKYGSLEFECPHADCKQINRRPKGKLIENCRYCGKSVRC